MEVMQVTIAIETLPDPPGPTQSTTPAPETSFDPTVGVTELDFQLVGFTLLLVAIVGILFNGLAITVFCKYRDLRSPTNTFILALCVCDFFMSAIGSPIPAYYAFEQTFIKSKAVCDIDAFAVYFLGLTSLYLLAAISVDRYLVIVKPYSDFVVTQRAANLAVAFCVALGFFWSLMPLVGWNEYALEGIGIACSVTWHRQDVAYKSFIIFIFIFCFILPFCVMLFCYLKIARTVKQIFSDTGVTTSRKHALIENKMLQTIIVMIVVFLVSWLPYVVVSFSETFGSGLPLSRLVTTIPALIAKASCVWNPIIYVAMNANFRTCFISLIPLFRSMVSPARPNRAQGDSLATGPATVRGGGSGGNMHLSVAYTQTEPSPTPTAPRAGGYWTSTAGVNSAEPPLLPEREERRSTQPCILQTIGPNDRAESSIAPSAEVVTLKVDTQQHGLTPLDDERRAYIENSYNCSTYQMSEESPEQDYKITRQGRNRASSDVSQDIPNSHNVFIVRSADDSPSLNERSSIIRSSNSHTHNVYTTEKELLAVQKDVV